MSNVAPANYSPQQLKQAVEWFVKLQSEQCSENDRVLFDKWFLKHENHKVAFEQAEQIWANIDDLKFIPLSSLDAARSAKPIKSNLVKLASCILFIFSALITGGIWLDHNAETVIYSTEIGEHRCVDLADNSHIDLNTNTRVSVRMSLLGRKVDLIQGEAQFEVSHNPFRPFTVTVGDLNIRDIGTVFNVRKQVQGAIVSVLEGEVELNNGRNVSNESLVAGNQRNYTEHSGLGILQKVEPEKISAWINGHLVFTRASLSDVIVELERYHNVHFIFYDKNLAKETLSGTFNSSDLNPFLHALETMLPIQVKRNGQQIELRRWVR